MLRAVRTTVRARERARRPLQCALREVVTDPGNRSSTSEGCRSCQRSRAGGMNLTRRRGRIALYTSQLTPQVFRILGAASKARVVTARAAQGQAERAAS